MKAIVAYSKNGVIGFRGNIPWHCSEDMRFFKSITMGQNIVVGRKTFDTLPPLPGRTIFVLTRDTTYTVRDGVTVVHQPEDLPEDVIVCGGAAIYDLLIDRCDEFYVTQIDEEVKGDRFFNPGWTAGFTEIECVECGEGYNIYRWYS